MGLLTAFLAFIVVGRALDGSIIGWVFGVGYAVILIAYWFPSALKTIKQMKNLSYDDENLYVLEDGVEEQIPFEQVKDVEIMSLNGIYRFNFFNKDLHDGFVTCKTSMWYPLNYPAVDKELNRVRALIRKSHQNYRDKIGNENRLASQT